MFSNARAIRVNQDARQRIDDFTPGWQYELVRQLLRLGDWIPFVLGRRSVPGKARDAQDQNPHGPCGMGPNLPLPSCRFSPQTETLADQAYWGEDRHGP
jgi:hypothetical protein